MCLSTLLITNISRASSHECSDDTHQNCDGNCECDGMECNYEESDNTDSSIKLSNNPKSDSLLISIQLLYD